jgi:DNA-binding Xre family transcriptional regulator
MTKLQRILDEKGWSVKDLERKIQELGESVQYYALTQMANGKRTNYSIVTLKKICAALEVTPNDIIEDEVSVFNQAESDVDLGF